MFAATIHLRDMCRRGSGYTKFLHWKNKYTDGSIDDNGLWEINGNYVYNFFGGRSSYEPSDDDEVLEFDSWEDALLFDACDDSQVTGWMCPDDGKFYGCKFKDHWKLANHFGVEEKELERRGWIKIMMLPQYLRYDHTYEAIWMRKSTPAQEKTLRERGFEREDPESTFWIM